MRGVSSAALLTIQYCNSAKLFFWPAGHVTRELAHVCPPVLTRSALCCVDCIRVLQLARQLVRTSRINKTTGAAVPRLDGATPAVCVLAWGLGGGSAAWRGHAKLRLLRTRKLSRRPPATRRAAGRSLLACFVFGDAARSSPPGLGGASPAADLAVVRGRPATLSRSRLESAQCVKLAFAV